MEAVKKYLAMESIRKGQLAVVGLGFYFLIYRFSIISLLVAGFLCIRFFMSQEIKKSLPVLCLLVGLFLSHRLLIHWEEKNQPRQINYIQLMPDTIQINGDRLSFQGKEKGKKFQVFYRLQSEKEKRYFSQLNQVIRLQVTADVAIPESQRNFEGFDYQKYLSTKGIYRLVTIDTIHSIERVFVFHPIDLLSVLRRKALVSIEQKFPDPMRHYMAGLLFGELGNGFEEMEEVYSSLGIIHLFALSGMQVGFFISLFRYPLLRLGMKRETVDFLQIGFSFLYAGVTGWSVSVIRSLVQKILGNRGVHGLENLVYTLFICYLVNPSFLLGAGGVLSFSYAFILTVFPSNESSGVKRIIVENLALSLGILPILIYYFFTFQPLSILLTFLCSFLFDSFFLPLLTILFFLSPFVVFAQFNGIFLLLETLLEWVGKNSFSALIIGKPTFYLLCLLLVSLMGIHDYWKKKRLAFRFGLLFLILVGLVKHPLTNEVTMVDIGQGDSIFLRDMKGKTILIDVGGRLQFADKEKWKQPFVSSNAQKTLLPYLKSRGIGKIDQLVLTHTDTDHIGDMEEVARNLKIGEILVSEGSQTDPLFVKRLQQMAVPVRIIKAGDSLSIMGSKLHVLYPWEKGDGGNNDSLVLYGKLLDKTFLFTGDLEEGELELIKRYPNLLVDVLKAGHHGSKGSSYPEFLEHIKPRIVLVSAGKKNRYKHPHAETLKRFAATNMIVYRTDKDGAVRFYGWNHWKVETVK